MGSVGLALLLVAASVHHADTGVKGTVTIGPTCPVERPGDPNCRDRPYTTTMKIVRRRSGSLVKRFSSHADGGFTVHVPAGRYLIEKTGSAALPSLAPVPVTVRWHRFTHVAFQFDSGIR